MGGGDELIVIKQIRLQTGLTQKAVARELGITQQAYSLWESEARMPRAAMLPKLAKVLGCSIEDLFREEIDAN